MSKLVRGSHDHRHNPIKNPNWRNREPKVPNDKIPTIIFVDFETTGFDPFQDEVTEVSLLRIQHKFLYRERFRFAQDILRYLVMPQSPQRAFIKGKNGICAADINGFDPEQWQRRGALDWPIIAETLAVKMKDCKWVGANAQFDYMFMLAQNQRRRCAKFNPRLADYHLCDLSSMAWPLVTDGEIPNPKLSTLAEHFDLDIKQGDVHNSSVDVEIAVKVYKHLIEP